MVSLEGSMCQVLHFCHSRPQLDAAKVLVGRRRIRGAQVGDGDRELERGWRRPLAPATSGCCQATGPILQGWAPAPGLLSSTSPFSARCPRGGSRCSLWRGEQWPPLVRSIPPSQTYGTSRVKRKTIRGLLVSWGDV